MSESAIQFIVYEDLNFYFHKIALVQLQEQDFALWCALEGKIYLDKPQTLAEMRSNIE